MRRILIKISLILLISVLVVGFATAKNQKKVVQKKKTESYFKITQIIDHGFRVLDDGDTLSEIPSYIFEFEVLNNSNLTITESKFNGYIFVPNSDYSVYSISFHASSCHSSIAKDNWNPNTKRTINIIMDTPVFAANQMFYADFKHTPETATLEIKFDGGNIDKVIESYLIDKFNIIEDWKEYQRKIGLRQ